MDKIVKNIVIGGVDGALGRTVVDTLAQSKEFNILGCCYSEPAKIELQNSVKDYPHSSKNIFFKTVDLADFDKVKSAVDEFVKKHGSIDAIINCAGGFKWAQVEETTVQDVEYLLKANFLSCFMPAKVALPYMKKQDFGRLVFISSRATLGQGTAGMAAYLASKAAVNQLVLSLHEEVKSYDINVNAVLPTIIDTTRNRKDMPKADASAWVKPEDLTQVILQLISVFGKDVRGALISVPGGV